MLPGMATPEDDALDRACDGLLVLFTLWLLLTRPEQTAAAIRRTGTDITQLMRTGLGRADDVRGDGAAGDAGGASPERHHRRDD